MGSNPFNNHQPMSVLSLHSQPIRIAFDIENHPVARQEVSRFISSLYVLWCYPCISPNLIAPCVQLPTDIGVILFVLLKQR